MYLLKLLMKLEMFMNLMYCSIKVKEIRILLKLWLSYWLFYCINETKIQNTINLTLILNEKC